MTEEEANSGRYGLWLLNNESPDTPAYSKEIQYKSWRATPKKYSRKKPHTVPLPAHDGRLEGVMVVDGYLTCKTNGQARCLSYPQTIELEPDQPRTWYLPDDCSAAAGLTVTRHYPRKKAIEFGEGCGYCLRPFDSQGNTYSNDTQVVDGEARLEIPHNGLKKWDWLLIDVLFASTISHCLSLFVKKKAKDEPSPGRDEEYQLERDDHIYIPRKLIDSGRCYTLFIEHCAGATIHY